MTSAFTGSARPLTCHELRARPMRSDICYACLSGTFCDERDPSHCVNLDRCFLDGREKCGLLQSCHPIPKLTVYSNLHSQMVTRCRFDVLRCISFVGALTAGAAMIPLLVLVQRRNGRAARRGLHDLTTTNRVLV